MPTNRITKYTFNGNLDFSSKIMSLDTAKWILSHLSAVNGKTIQFSTELWSLIEDDEEAIELLEEAYSRGWNSNEPDIIVISDSGYNGVVRVNGADMQLTETSTGSGIWIKQSAGSITAMDDFLKHRNASGIYNSTSINVKKVRFGKNINTASCTTFAASFNCENCPDSNMEVIDVTHLNVSNATTLRSCFASINASINNVYVKIKGYEDWDVSNVSNIAYIFGSKYIKNDYIDLHKWHIKSGATISAPFGTMNGHAGFGVNRPSYYTPGYWATDPMNDSNIASTAIKPVVYPYHDITIAATSSFNGNVRINDTNIATTKDNNLGIWYYDIPSQGELTQINLNYGSSSKAYITSISIGDRFANQDALCNTWAAFADCASLRTVRIPEGMNVNLNQTFRGSGLSTPVLCGVYGFDKIKNQSQSGGEFLFRKQSNMYYVDLGQQTFTTYFNYAFYNCTNLRRISNFPGIENTVSATTPMTGCTNLTYIDASGPISKTISFEDCPLNLNSAKVILSALQQVTSATLTFSSTTKTAINGNSEALSLVTQARSKGWTISLS